MLRTASCHVARNMMECARSSWCQWPFLEASVLKSASMDILLGGEMMIPSKSGFSTLSGVTLPSSRNLWDIVKRDQFEGHDARHIVDIWKEYHADPKKNRIAGAMTGPKFLAFAEIATSSPAFVLPVFRGPNSFETFLLQCQLPLVAFTSLEQYKLHGSAAPPHFIVTHYTELLDSKGIVLVRGDIVQPDSLDLVSAGSLLANCHEFYIDRGTKVAFVHAFNHRPQDFNFVKMLDSMGHATEDLKKNR